MADMLRVYRRFYRISISDQSSSYTLMDPISLSATVRNLSLGNIVVEASASTVNAEVGVYYADLVSSLYNSDHEYEIEWQVAYTIGAPVKNLYTRFRFPENGQSTGVVVMRELDFQLANEPALRIEIERKTLDYTIERP